MSINITNLIISVVQIIGGVAMITTIIIAIKQYLLQRREVKVQNQRIINLLECINANFNTLNNSNKSESEDK